MKYILTNLGSNSTFEQFREEHIKIFGYDYFEGEDDVPTGDISTVNHPFISIYGGNVELWIDDNSGEVIRV